MKKFFLFLVIAAGAWACKIDSIGFTNPATARDTFFSEVIAQARERGMVTKDVQLTGTMDVYRVRFREQRVAESNVMEWRMISENDPRFNHTDARYTSGQNIYIYRLHMSDPKEDVFVYYSMAVNADTNECTGIGHAYLGKLQQDSVWEEDANKNKVLKGINARINFYERLCFKQKNSISKLVPDKKSARRKIDTSDDANEHTIFKDMLRFTLKKPLPRGSDTLSISEITVLEINKTGGNNPVYYPVDILLGTNALSMTKQ
jgi:hypothetical protein